MVNNKNLDFTIFMIISIQKTSVLIGILHFFLQSPMFDGKMPNWYHFNCFFAKQRPKEISDIAHFESIRWEDQKKIEAKLGSITNLIFKETLQY